MRSDSKLARTLFRKLFSDEEIVQGNLTGETTKGHEGTKPVKFDEERLEFIYNIFRSRLVALSEHLPVTMERMSKQCFRNYIRDAANPLKKAARDATKPKNTE